MWMWWARGDLTELWPKIAAIIFPGIICRNNAGPWHISLRIYRISAIHSQWSHSGPRCYRPRYRSSHSWHRVTQIHPQRLSASTVSTATLNIINKSQRILIVINNTKHDLGKKYYTVCHTHQFEIHCCCFNILASYGDIASLHVNTLV